MDVWAAIAILYALTLANSLLVALTFAISYRQSKTEACLLNIIELVDEKRGTEAGELRADVARLKYRIENLEKMVYGKQ